MVACLSLRFTPVLVYIVLRRASKERQSTLDDAIKSYRTLGVYCSCNELNIQLLNFLLEKQDFARRGNESYQKHENMSKRPILEPILVCMVMPNKEKIL